MKYTVRKVTAQTFEVDTDIADERTLVTFLYTARVNPNSFYFVGDEGSVTSGESHTKVTYEAERKIK